MRKEIKHKNSNERDKLMTTVTMTMEIAWFVSNSHSQSVNQSFCHHSITNSESKYTIVKSIKIIQLTSKIVKALTKVVEMNCVENLKSKNEIQMKLKNKF